MAEHYVVEQSAPRWLITILTSLGGVLTASMLLWIASSQLQIVTTTAVIQRDIGTLTKLFENNSTSIRQIWPRLRAHGENIEVLRKHLEDVCACEVRLNEPDNF